MGALCTGGFAMSASAEVATSEDIVWATIADIEATPVYLSSVSSVHRTGNSWKEGTTWRETRLHDGEAFILVKTVTSLSNEKPRSVGINVGFQENGSDAIKTAVNTSTLTVYATGVDTCRLVGTLAWIPPGILSRIYNVLCVYCIEKSVVGTFQTEMDEIAAEAEKRAKQGAAGVATAAAVEDLVGRLTGGNNDAPLPQLLPSQ